MSLDEILDRRPIVVAIAGPNGAGKSTFYEAFLASTPLRFLNADDVARELEVDPYTAATLLGRLRDELVERRESFIFETVFSDPVGEKVAFLRRAADAGYTVVLCFIGLETAALSQERIAMRVSQGGHDVPAGKVAARHARSRRNLARALRSLPVVLVYDNSDLRAPYRPIATFVDGKPVWRALRRPRWFRALERC